MFIIKVKFPSDMYCSRNIEYYYMKILQYKYLKTVVKHTY